MEILNDFIFDLIYEFAGTAIIWYTNRYGQKQKGMHELGAFEEYIDSDIHMMIYLDYINSDCIYKHLIDLSNYILDKTIIYKNNTYNVYIIDYINHIFLYSKTECKTIYLDLTKCWFGMDFLKKGHIHMIHSDIIDYLQNNIFKSKLKITTYKKKHRHYAYKNVIDPNLIDTRSKYFLDLQ